MAPNTTAGSIYKTKVGFEDIKMLEIKRLGLALELEGTAARQDAGFLSDA